MLATTGATDAMNVQLRLRRHIHIDHCFKLRNIQPTRGHVGRHQHRAAAIGELHQHLIAVPLLQLAVQRQRAETLRLQQLRQRLTLVLGIAKSERADRPIVVEQVRNGVQTITVCDFVEALANFAAVVLRFNGDALRVFEELRA